ncbi:hypothetical protein QJ527_12260 [Enterococcus mundtii]|uniref:hypothetical protein n=1 Tax=Enterococcus TaxID=1350 RepID=UPI002543B318|nr:hypothetical protein [Enterococcus mundtii]MDK4212306.1 hypothetical protein [Enterococcus mundtii]
MRKHNTQLISKNPVDVGYDTYLKGLNLRKSGFTLKRIENSLGISKYYSNMFYKGVSVGKELQMSLDRNDKVGYSNYSLVKELIQDGVSLTVIATQLNIDVVRLKLIKQWYMNF